MSWPATRGMQCSKRFHWMATGWQKGGLRRRLAAVEDGETVDRVRRKQRYRPFVDIFRGYATVPVLCLRQARLKGCALYEAATAELINRRPCQDFSTEMCPVFLARLSSACQARRNREENMRRHEGDQSTKCMQGLGAWGSECCLFFRSAGLIHFVIRFCFVCQRDGRHDGRADLGNSLSRCSQHKSGGHTESVQ